MKTVFLRVLDADDKREALRAAIQRHEVSDGGQRFDLEVASFAAVPRSPFAYWVSDRMRSTFTKLPPLRARHSAVRGAYTTDDFRFYRVCWEGLPGWLARSREETREGKTHVSLAKGGKYTRFFADVYLQLRWAEDGAEAKAFLSAYRERKGWGTDWSACLNGHDRYFEAGLTWSRRSQRGITLRAMPVGCIFADNGPGLFVEGGSSEDLLALLAVVNSGAFGALVELQMAFGLFQVGTIQRTPIPNTSQLDRSELAALARRAWSLRRSLDARDETGHAFALPAALQVAGADFAARAAAWSEHVRSLEAELAVIQAEIDERCFVLYGIDEADRRAITEGFGRGDTWAESSDATDVEEDDAGEDKDEAEFTADATRLAAEFVSWAVGVAFGRFDLRLATGACPLPTEPEPFDRLPACSPGMLTGEDGLPLAQPPAGYPQAFPGTGLLVDDPGHAQDLISAVRAIFDMVFGADVDRWWYDVAALLDPKGHDLRGWIASCFFEHHLKRYSKSRRKAPILWQLSTASGRYSVWLYAHRLTRDSFFQLQNDVVGPKLIHEEGRHNSLIQSAGGSPSVAERKEIAAHEVMVEELRTMLEEVKRVAPLWNPNLDDGVVLVMAPLWRLVPQHKPWQRELKAKCAELTTGKYDWAHLAMDLWPERVVPNCAKDRSLAIAHGLEDVFWVEGTDGKWTARITPTRTVDELVRERTSPAVKAAQKSLLEAPVAQGGTGRGRGARGRAAASTNDGGSR